MGNIHSNGYSRIPPPSLFHKLFQQSQGDLCLVDVEEKLNMWKLNLHDRTLEGVSPENRTKYAKDITLKKANHRLAFWSATLHDPAENTLTPISILIIDHAAYCSCLLHTTKVNGSPILVGRYFIK